jgi:nucleoside-diphosphate-sugar epimerase
MIYKPLPADDPVQRQPDMTRAETLLHWKPKVSLEEGLSETIAYFRELLDEEVC